MKLLVVLFLFSQSVYAELENLDRELDWSIYSETQARDFLQTFKHERNLRLLLNIERAKLLTIYGDIETSQKLLTQLKINYTNPNIQKVVKLMLARNYFILGAYENTKKELRTYSFVPNKDFRESCLLLYMSSFSDKSDRSLAEMDRCVRLNAADLLSDQFWYRLVKSEQNGTKNQTNYYERLLFEMKQATDYKKVESWLKYGIYFNYEDLISENLAILPSMAILDSRLRTLSAYNLYNAGKINDSNEYISNIQSFNGNYLKANIEVQNENYKLSYAFNKAALKKRKHSIYANQLNLSMGWLNNEYEDTRNSLNRLVSHGDLQNYQEIYNATLLYQENKLYRSNFEIKKLNDSFNSQLPYPGRILATSVYIDRLDSEWIESANKACAYYSVVNCWLKMQSTIWKDYSKVFKEAKEEEKRISILKNISALVKDTSDDIEDSVFINQRDIEELDLITEPKMGEFDEYD